MPRTLLLVVFTNEPCRRNHAFMYALDLAGRGHQIRILLEGEGTRCLAERTGRFGELFEQALQRGLVAGACQTASRGCSTGEPARNVEALAKEQGLPLFADMQGHASIAPFIDEGYEVVTF